MSVVAPTRLAPPTQSINGHSPPIYRFNSSNPSVHTHHQSMIGRFDGSTYVEQDRGIPFMTNVPTQRISTPAEDLPESYKMNLSQEVLPSSVLNAPSPPGPTMTSETLAPQTTVLQEPQPRGVPFPSTATISVERGSSQVRGSPLYSPGRSYARQDDRFISRSSRSYTTTRSDCSRCKHGKRSSSRSRHNLGTSSPKTKLRVDHPHNRNSSIGAGYSDPSKRRKPRRRSLSNSSLLSSRTRDTSSRTPAGAGNRNFKSHSRNANERNNSRPQNFATAPRDGKEDSSSQTSFVPPRDKVLVRRNSSSENSRRRDSDDWSLTSKWLTAVRAGPLECPDYILTKHPGFQGEKHPSPFALYYFDETAPNELLLANDVKGEHPVAVAKKQLQAFLNCEGGRQETFEVEGDAYAPDGVIDVSSSSSDSEESGAYAKSYYTESAFTSINPKAIMRGRALQAMQGGKKSRGRDGKKGCCDKARQLSGPTTDLGADETSSRETDTLRESFGDAGVPGRIYSYPQGLNGPTPVYGVPAYPVRPGFVGSLTAPAYRGPMSDVYQKFSKVRKTNYVEYTPPATIAKRYNHPGYQSALEAEAARQQRNAAIPSVWPRPGLPVTADGQRAPSTVGGTQTSRRRRGGRSTSRDSPVTRSRQPFQDVSSGHRRRHVSGRETTPSRSGSESRTRSARGKSGSIERYRERRGHPRPGLPGHGAAAGHVCPQCKGSGHVRDQAGRAGLCGECCVVRRGGGWCCGTSQPDHHHRRASPRYAQSSFDDSVTFGRSTYGSTYTGTAPTIEPETVNFEVLGRGDDSISIDNAPRYKPPSKGEEKRDYGYHLRKHFFDAANLKAPAEGTKFKDLPQYSVSYRNYPTICYDVVVPTSQKDFYRVRKAPGFA